MEASRTDKLIMVRRFCVVCDTQGQNILCRTWMDDEVERRGGTVEDYSERDDRYIPRSC